MAAQSIFSWLTGGKNKSPHPGQKRVPVRRCRLGIEPREDRPASLDDITTGHGKITLRKAIQAVKTDAPVEGSTAVSGADSIHFAPVFSAGGPKTIGLSMIGYNSDFLGGAAMQVTSELTIQGPTEDNGLTLAGPGDPFDQDATMPLYLVAVHCLAPID